MKLAIAARWRAGEAEIDPRLLPLLRAVEKTGSLKHAVAALRLSYRHAWGLVGAAERAIGQKLVMMERGRGARLSPFSLKLLEADDAAARVLDRELSGVLQELHRGAAPPGIAGSRRLVIHASHDFALAELRDALAHGGSIAVDLHFRGSLDSLASLARGECQVAGFHLPEATAGRAALAPYRPALRMRNLRLVRFVRRRQGLMVARGNPKRLYTLADLARSGARFVNRQPESGTRLCLDRLLAAARLQPEQINGYRVEEFTHAAVAATVASGMADAGFGIEAAARQHGLDFVPLAEERYFLAARAATLARAPGRALVEALSDRAFLDRIAPLPGYDAAGIGEILGASAVLREA